MRICSTSIPVQIVEDIPQPAARPVEVFTPGMVKMFYEANPNTNAFTNAEKEKLAKCSCDVVTPPAATPLPSVAGGITLTVAEQTALDNLVATGVPRNTFSKTEVSTLLNSLPTFEEVGGILWQTNMKYKVGMVVVQSNVVYKCIVDHVSTTWAWDILNWEFIISDPGTF